MTNDAEQATDADAADEQAAEGADGDEQTVEDATLAARVREHDDALADEVADLEARVEELEGDL
jgi:molecular chaperone GrpE